MQSKVIGRLQRYTDFGSRYVPAGNVDIWLPPDYEDQDRLPVIYMQDGQNLFDSEVSSSGVDWAIDKAMMRLKENVGIGPAIVVALWSTEQRWLIYMPRKPLDLPGYEQARERFQNEQGELPVSDAYLRFLVEEAKPFVDEAYKSRPGRRHTFVMGASMGALISLYALCEYPQVFGGAACLSSHWPAGEGAVIDYLKEALPPAGKHRFYFDHGTATLDALYPPYQHAVDTVMAEKGYQADRDWISRQFDEAAHSEHAWRKRVDIPLSFLLNHSD